MKKILFFHQGIDEPSTVFRICIWEEYFKKNDIHMELYPKKGKLYPHFKRIIKNRKNYFNVFRVLYILAFYKKYDAIFVQKFLFPKKLSWLDNRLFKLPNLVLDIPDSIFCIQNDKNNESPVFEEKLRNMTRFASSIMVSNKFIHDWVGMPNKTIVMPTVLDMKKIPVRKNIENKEKVIIGWNGQGYQLPLVYPLFEILKEISDLENIEIRFISSSYSIDERKKIQAHGINIIPYNKEEEFNVLSEIDIGLMPMDDGVISLGKFSLKLIQYLSSGVAVVCSPIGSNCEVVEDGVNGYFASDPNEWKDKILSLVESYEKRKKFGENGRITVEEKYSTTANWNAFYSALNL